MVRSPMQVDDGFRKKLKELQKEIMKKKGEYRSMSKITNDITKMPEWEMMEKKLLGDIQQVEFRINFDRRNKQ